MTSPSRFLFSQTPIADLLVVERQRRGDDRGFLSRFYCAEEMKAAGFVDPVVQVNHTLTRQAGAVRGMHFQLPPAAEDKFVSCLRGRVYDVAVDLRKDSPTFLQWHAEILSADNIKSFFIPKGFAHGFQTLEDDCELIYLHTEFYRPEVEAGLNPLDPALAIAWPLPIGDISPRDRSHAPIAPDYHGLKI
jgi:dTDP-4-dehydrorhamnose 3,5-epimerase